MPKQKRVRFVVEGSGAFPFDMLRYDQAFPESEVRDSPHLGFTRDHGDEYFGTRRITLLSDCPHAPTFDRWKSFGWRVADAEHVT